MGGRQACEPVKASSDHRPLSGKSYLFQRRMFLEERDPVDLVTVSRAQHSQARGRRPEKVADLSEVMVLVEIKGQDLDAWEPLPSLVSRKHSCNLLGFS